MQSVEKKDSKICGVDSSSSKPLPVDFNFGTPAKLLKHTERFLSTGCPNLDVFLKGGIATKGITQIYGAAGSGKTQLALQLCLAVQLPISCGGLNAGAAYICTESIFPSGRIQQLLQESRLRKKFNITGDVIFVNHVTDIEDLMACILQRIPCLLSQCNVKLLVIDSVAAPFRAEYSSKELKGRAKSLRAIGYQLHDFSRKYGTTIVCINQVSAIVTSEPDPRTRDTEQPALGILWTTVITNNIYLCRNGGNRYLHTMQSSFLPRDKIEYKITDSGVTAGGEDE